MKKLLLGAAVAGGAAFGLRRLRARTDPVTPDSIMIQGEMKTATVAERPDLVEPGWERTRDTLPEYNDHGDVLNVYWGRLTGGAAPISVPPGR